MAGPLKRAIVKAFDGKNAEQVSRQLQKFLDEKKADTAYTRFSLRQMALAATPNGSELVAVFDAEFISTS